MPRRTLPIALLLLSSLACAGITPPTTRVTRRALSIDLLDGTVSTDEDHGASGDYDVESAVASQALSWEPVDDLSSDQQLDQLFAALREIFPDGVSDEPPPHLDATVGGQPARQLETLISGRKALLTAWQCPEAGVRAQLLTLGLWSAPTTLHEQSLASVTCGAEPLVVEEGPDAWRLTADAAAWDSARQADGTVRWTRGDGAIVVTTMNTTPLTDPDLPAMCTGTLRLAHRGMAEEVRMDEARSDYRDVDDGCVHTWTGVDADDGSPRSGRIDLRTCGARGFMAMCVVVLGNVPAEEACAGLFTCAG
jgi:hypothetical protein